MNRRPLQGPESRFDLGEFRSCLQQRKRITASRQLGRGDCLGIRPGYLDGQLGIGDEAP